MPHMLFIEPDWAPESSQKGRPASHVHIFVNGNMFFYKENYIDKRHF